MDTNEAFGIAVGLVNSRQPFTIVLNDGRTLACSLMVGTRANLTGGAGVVEVVSNDRTGVIDVGDIREFVIPAGGGQG